MRSALLIALALLVSCATTRRYESFLESWVGKDLHELTARWGEPARVHTYSDGTRGYEYHLSDTHVAADRNISSAIGCRTFFFIDTSQRVRGWNWEGHDCVAR